MIMALAKHLGLNPNDIDEYQYNIYDEETVKEYMVEEIEKDLNLYIDRILSDNISLRDFIEMFVSLDNGTVDTKEIARYIAEEYNPEDFLESFEAGGKKYYYNTNY